MGQREGRREEEGGSASPASSFPPSLPPAHLLQFPVRGASVSVSECMDVSEAVTLQLPSGVERAHRVKRAHLTPPSAGLRLISSVDATEERWRRSGEPWKDRLHSSLSSSSQCCWSPGPPGSISVSPQHFATDSLHSLDSSCSPSVTRSSRLGGHWLSQARSTGDSLGVGGGPLTAYVTAVVVSVDSARVSAQCFPS